jgi:hypothetical protein
VVGAGEGKGNATADRAEEDDPARPLANQRQQRLGNGDLPGQVDLDLTAEVLDRHRLQWARQADAGVVDQAVEAGASQLAREQLSGRGDRLGIGDVEHQRGQALRARRPQ